MTEALPSPTIFGGNRGFAWLRERWHLLHGGDGIVVCGDSHARYHLRTVLTPDAAREMVMCHRERMAAGTYLKSDVKRKITLVSWDGANYVVKEYLHVFPWLSCSPDCRCWLCNNRLHGAVPCLGWVREGRRGYVIMADAGRQSLSLRHDAYDYGHMAPKYRRAGELMGMLHEQGIFHADLKPNNFVTAHAEDDQPEVALIDCDDVRFLRTLSVAQRTRNLAQFLGGLSFALRDASHRASVAALFLDGYCGYRRLDHAIEDRALFDSLVARLYPQFLAEYREIADVIH